jgi:hypothetical protein
MKTRAIFGLMIIMWLIPVIHAEEEFQISYSCINCHQDRYEEWARSMHALSVKDPVFEAAYLRALQSDPKYRYYCMTCHSPTTTMTNDLNLTKSISIEGVTCSFCHTVSGVENNSYIFSQNNPMFGPYKDSTTEAHASRYSEILTKSEFCAGCHEFSINNMPISETYSEWKEGPYSKEGKQCQDCHMEAKQGVAAKNGTIREKVYQHFWYGGHSGIFLEKAFQMESQVGRIGNKAKVTLNITNSNVGHKIPSGFPARKVVLSFRANDENGREIFSDTRVYAKTLVDQYGNEVYDFWTGVSIASDNRIKPRETRIEVFEFEVPEGTNKLETSATLTYQLEAEIITRTLESMNVEIAKSSITTMLESYQPAAEMAKQKEAPTLGWIGTITVILAAVLLGKKKRNRNGR